MRSIAAAVVTAAHVLAGVVEMPRFTGQNKKRIDPRYFLEETTNRNLDEQWEPDEQERAWNDEEAQYKRGGGDPYAHKTEETDTEELVRKMMIVLSTPTNHCGDNPDDEDCFSSDFLSNMLTNFTWPEEIEEEEELARYLCGPEGRDSEWSWVAAEVSQQYLQLKEEGKI